MKQKTKIIATLGPASESRTAIKKLIEAGVSAFRFNLKHNTLKWHDEAISKIRSTAQKLDANVSIIVDIPGVRQGARYKKNYISHVKFAIHKSTDFIALSFIKDEKDINSLKILIKKLKGKQRIIAKIETSQSVININKIIQASDAVMIARGDLGKEIAIERVPKIQKLVIQKCREHSKPVIVATQMLQSMVSSKSPSRAEVADIANAVFDKSDALMLSEETAIGAYPVKSVVTMSKIARYNEVQPDSASKRGTVNDHYYPLTSFQDMIIASSVKFSNQICGYVIFTESGRSARSLSRFRTSVPVYAFSTHKHVVKQLTLSYGVKANHIKLSKNPTINIKNAIKLLKRERLVTKGDEVVVIFGNNVGVPESNNTLSILTV